MLPDLDFGVQAHYFSFRQSVALDDRTFYIFMGLLSTAVPFFLFNTYLHFIWNVGVFQKYLVEPNLTKYPDAALIRNCIFRACITHLLVGPLLAYILYPFIISSNPGYINGPLPTCYVFLAQYLGCTLIEDTLFYWTHRMLHHDSVYRHFHKEHHKFKRTIGFAQSYCHPVEFVFSNLIPTVSGPAILGMHVLPSAAWMTMRILESVDAHCGYRFPWSPFHMFAFQGGVERHDFHHSHNVGSYGSWTKFWDWAMGTDKAFNEFMMKKKGCVKKEHSIFTKEESIFKGID